MASTIQPPSSGVLSRTYTKESNTANYVNTGISASQYIMLSAAEQSGGAGAPCSIAVNGDSYFIYLYYANGTAYTGAATLKAYFIPLVGG